MKNSKGSVWYGMHFYPGVAEYAEPGKQTYRVFLNEDTIRSMDASFAGRPVFVMHVDEVEQDVDVLRGEADGWVTESFYNASDGKHWCKFIAVSEKAEQAIKRGFQLSNCYIPKAFGQGGLWNGVSYAKEITGGEYEHLAIVPNPRYEESVILSPEQFKKYNEDKLVELKRMSNSNKESGFMLKFFKRAKVENAIDLEGMSVVLPKSTREVTIEQMVNELDAFELAKKEPKIANGDHLVECGGKKMTLNELLEKHKAMNDELEAMKAEKAKNDDPDEVGDPSHGDVDESTADVMNDEDEEEKKRKKKEAEEAAEKTKNDLAEAKRVAKEKADKVRNADKNVAPETAVVHMSADRVARGKVRYGS